MNRIWHVASEIKKEFVEENSKIDPVVLQILHNRGVFKKEEIDNFLNGKFDDLADPFLFNQMEEACELIINHVKSGSKICVYGDYDADGITSSVLLHDLLTIFKADVFSYIPDRVKEGYGLSMDGLKKVMKKKASLIITVDGGIRNKEQVEFVKSNNIDVIITDHHPAPEKKEDLPDTILINPQVKGEKYPSKTLAGVGVAFKLAQALIIKSKLKNEQKETLSRRMLDLVAIGTVADCMVLLGENRILVREGLKILENTRRIGLKELKKIAKIDKKPMEAWNIGFQIAPRLNASSRMASAVAAFELLVSKDAKECVEKALDLDKKNSKRQELTEEAVAQVEEQIKLQKDEKIIIGVAPEDKPWNEGIVGLVAGKITEKYYKPCIVITRGESEWKGSGRSIDEFNLAAALNSIKDSLLKQGGHAKACGLSVEKEKIKEFSDRLRKLAKKELEGIELKPKINIDVKLEISQVKKSLTKAIRALSPFGQKNPEPKFISENVQIKDIIKMGLDEQHIKFRFGGVWAVGFNMTKKCTDYMIGDMVDIVYTIGINEFNGREEVQMKIVDIRSVAGSKK